MYQVNHANIREIDMHIMLPIVREVIYGLIHSLGYHELFANNIFFKTQYSETSNTGDEDLNPMAVTDRLVCNVRSPLNHTQTKWDANSGRNAFQHGYMTTNMYNHPPVFLDPKAQIRVYEDYVPTSIQVDCEATFLHQSNAEQLLQTLYKRFAGENNIYNKDIVYDYPIPWDIIELLAIFYKYKSNPEQPTLGEYLKTHFGAHLSVLKNRDDPSKFELIIKHLDMRTIVSVSVNDEMPSVDKKGRRARSLSIQFAVFIQFGRPINMRIHYPLVIDNKPIDKSLVPRQMNGEFVYLEGTMRNKAQDDFRKYYPGYTYALQVPMEDNWYLPSNSGVYKDGFRPFVICLMTVSADEDTIIDLTQPLVFDYTIADWILPIISKYTNLSIRNEAHFSVAVFSNILQVDASMLELTEDLKLRIKCRDTSKVYHLVISEQTRHIMPGFDEALSSGTVKIDPSKTYNRVIRAKYNKEKHKNNNTGGNGSGNNGGVDYTDPDYYGPSFGGKDGYNLQLRNLKSYIICKRPVDER